MGISFHEDARGLLGDSIQEPLVHECLSHTLQWWFDAYDKKSQAHRKRQTPWKESYHQLRSALRQMITRKSNQ